MNVYVNRENVAITPDIEWIYEPPVGFETAKMQLLTNGGLAILGYWGDGTGYKAWYPLPKRNKAKEAQQ